jgi:hypothetical protein
MKRTSPVAWDLVGCGAILFLIVVPTCLAGIRSHGDWRILLLPEVFGSVALATVLVVAGLFGRSWLAGRRSQREKQNGPAGKSPDRF